MRLWVSAQLNITETEIAQSLKWALAKLLQRQIIQLDGTIDIDETKHNRIGHKITIFRRPVCMDGIWKGKHMSSFVLNKTINNF